MPHPIYGAPSHRLERVRFTLHLPLDTNQRTTKLEVHGVSSMQRGSLWHVTESWAAHEQECGYQPADALQHVALVALQDHPASQHHFERCMVGEGWQQLELEL